MADCLAFTENPLNNAGAAILELVNIVLDYGIDIRIRKSNTNKNSFELSLLDRYGRGYCDEMFLHRGASYEINEETVAWLLEKMINHMDERLEVKYPGRYGNES